MASPAFVRPPCTRLVVLLATLIAMPFGLAADHELRPGDPWPVLGPGDTVHLAPGAYAGPWEIDVAGVRVEADGATLTGPAEGSALILTAQDVEVRGLAVRDAGAAPDLYAPDAAVWLLGCDRCRLAGLDTQGTPAGLRVESSRDVRIEGARLRGAPEGPGLTAYQADGLDLVDADVQGFLDGVYVERSDDVRIATSDIRDARRYGLHVMFGAGLEVSDTTVTGGGVGSAVMYGRDARLSRNRFEGHVGPLAYGLLLQEMDGAVVEDTSLTGNTVGALVVSAPDVRFARGTIAGSGTGLLVRRTPEAAASAVRVHDAHFAGNVADVAVDDPDAAVTLRGNAYDAASPLDRDGDGVSDTPYLPTSSFALLSSREPDLSLFAGSPGVRLWEAAEATVPGLRMASLHDPAPRPAAAQGAGVEAQQIDLIRHTSAPAGRRRS
ncbi:MAG: hypothetical protein GVY27_06475, partial [Deinococcus-Thermus bacterium]|nr:hypothetical protein [Deinococcota bacterium]